MPAASQGWGERVLLVASVQLARKGLRAEDEKGGISESQARRIGEGLCPGPPLEPASCVGISERWMLRLEPQSS